MSLAMMYFNLSSPVTLILAFTPESQSDQTTINYSGSWFPVATQPFLSLLKQDPIHDYLMILIQSRLSALPTVMNVVAAIAVHPHNNVVTVIDQPFTYQSLSSA